MFGHSYYIRSRIFNNKYRVVGIVAGFYLLQRVDEDNYFVPKKSIVPIFCAKLFYKRVENDRAKNIQ